ncbi:MAG: antibiotic biosynthesis monooxygenase, partial [Nitrosomonadales bacterium]|nr:antibiotic biosynthesis monooxygenase [Nitrosomonadales bacterium]
THRVNKEKQEQYEQWLEEIGPVCKATEGLLDLHVIRPVRGLSDTYSVIIRYDTEQHLKQWIHSDERNRLIAKAQDYLLAPDTYQIKSGLDFWFMPDGAKAKIPVKWKQFLVTWSAIYPLVIGVPLVLLPLFRWLNIPEQHYIDSLFLTAIVVFLMVYIVMPRYTKLVRNWLFK